MQFFTSEIVSETFLKIEWNGSEENSLREMVACHVDTDSIDYQISPGMIHKSIRHKVLMRF